MNDFFKFLEELEKMAKSTNAKLARYRFEYHGGIVEIIYRTPKVQTKEK